MNLIDTSFELLNPNDFDQVITELQAAKRELVEALLEAVNKIGDAPCYREHKDKYRALAKAYKAKP